MENRKGMFIVDLGSSALRVALLDNAAKVIWMNKKDFPVLSQGVLAEQNAEDWIADLDAMMQEAKLWTKGKAEIEALVLTAQRSSVVPVNREGKATRPAILWQDTRHLDICRRLKEEIPNLQEITGSRMHTAYAGARILWLKEYEPNIYNEAYRIFNPQQFLGYRLTGSDATDYTYASRTHLFDINKLSWSTYILESLGLDKEKLGTVQAPGTVIGTLSDEWSERWDLPQNLPVYSAGGDQQCSSWAMGVIREGSYELTASEGGYFMTLAKALPGEISACTVNCSAIPHCYNYENTMYNCKSVLDYLIRLLLPNKTENEVRDILAESDFSPNGVVVLPLFAGKNEVPGKNAHQADILNISLETTAADIIQGALQSIACEFRCQMEDVVRVTGVPANRVLVSGALTKYPSLNQMLSELLHVKVLKPASFETAVYGAWMSVAVSRRIYSNYEDALGAIHSQIHTDEVQGAPAKTKAYQGLLERYKGYRKSKSGGVQ